MDRRLFLIAFFSFLELSLATSDIEILYSPESIIFQNTTDPLSSSDLSKFISQCLGYTTNKPNWNGFIGYKNIAKNIPKSVVIFHIPTSLSSIAVHTFPIEINSHLKDQYFEIKDTILSRHKQNGALTDFVIFNNKNDDKNPTTMASQIGQLEKYLNKLESKNQPALLWFEMFAHKKELAKMDDISGHFQKIINQIRYLFGVDVLIMSIYDENQMAFDRVARQSDKDEKVKKDNLAYEYSHDFHTSFVSIGFAAILFVLAVFVIAVSMWNIDPGRDSIIYRLTSQKIKKDQ